jgi:hypothetical protein
MLGRVVIDCEITDLPVISGKVGYQNPAEVSGLPAEPDPGCAEDHREGGEPSVRASRPSATSAADPICFPTRYSATNSLPATR